MKLAKIIIIGILSILLLMGCKQESKTLHIAAAASLTDVMDEVKELYEKKHDIDLEFNFAGSGKLAQQIEQGAPVDVFISANETWMDMLGDKALIKKKTREDVTGNKLVLIAEEGTELSYDAFEDIKKEDVDHIALGVPESVPAGEYAKTALKQLDYWDLLEDEMVFAKDVRQVLTYVESGNATIGFVYLSDALISDKVTVLAESDPLTHQSIVYPGAITTDSKLEKEGQAFLDFLQSEEIQAIFKEYGFSND